MATLLLAVLLLAGVLVWLIKPGRREARPPDVWEPEANPEELEAAEEEVRDLGTAQPPEEGLEEDEWGPGAPGRS